MQKGIKLAVNLCARDSKNGLYVPGASTPNPAKEAVTGFSCVAFSEVRVSSSLSPEVPPVSSETH